jgi:hypothetical protein
MTAEKQIIGTAPFGYLCKIGILQEFQYGSPIMITNAPIAACVFKEQRQIIQNAAAPFLPEQLRKFPGPGKIRRTEMRFIHPYGYYGFTEFIPEIPPHILV